MCRDAQEAQVLSEEEVELSAKLGFWWVSLGSIIRGWAQADRGGVEAGLAMIDEGLSAYLGAGAQLSQTYQLAIWAETLLRAGRPEEGLRLTDDALESMAETGERFWEGELHRLRGLLFLALEPPRRDEALSSLRKAVELACRQKAPMGILRAAASLARMAADSHERDEARELLAGVLSAFANKETDLPDLREAEALLSELEDGSS